MTDRRLQCLAFSLMYGNDAAAKLLGVTPQTVKNNLSTLYRELGVRGRSQAAHRLGWLDIPDHLKTRGG